MSDLIDRQKAITAICEDGTWLESQGCTEITMCERKQRDADILSELPTIDAVEVVRCRDCKWWNGYYRECESPNWNTGTDEYIVQPAGMFCGWGERKSEEDPSHPCADSVMMGE